MIDPTRYCFHIEVGKKYQDNSFHSGHVWECEPCMSKTGIPVMETHIPNHTCNPLPMSHSDG